MSVCHMFTKYLHQKKTKKTIQIHIEIHVHLPHHCYLVDTMHRLTMTHRHMLIAYVITNDYITQTQPNNKTKTKNKNKNKLNTNKPTNIYS